MPHSVLSPQQKPKNSKRKENLIFDLNCVALPDKIYESFKIHGLSLKPGKWEQSTSVDVNALLGTLDSLSYLFSVVISTDSV